jgi:acyl-CoA dehydrogenase
LHKKLHVGLKNGQINPAPGEALIDAAVEAGVLQAAEAINLREAETARRRVIDVDDFDKDELTLGEGKVR